MIKKLFLLGLTTIVAAGVATADGVDIVWDFEATSQGDDWTIWNGEEQVGQSINDLAAQFPGFVYDNGAGTNGSAGLPIGDLIWAADPGCDATLSIGDTIDVSLDYWENAQSNETGFVFGLISADSSSGFAFSLDHDAPYTTGDGVVALGTLDGGVYNSPSSASIVPETWQSFSFGAVYQGADTYDLEFVWENGDGSFGSFLETGVVIDGLDEGGLQLLVGDGHPGSIVDNVQFKSSNCTDCIPEPSSALLAFVALTMGLLRRKR